MKPAIRDIRISDFDSIFENYLTYFDELSRNPSFGLLIPDRKPELAEEVDWFAELYKSYLSGSAIVSVAEIDGKVVGMCEVRHKTRQPESHRGVLGIAVLATFRGRGIGSELLSQTLLKCKGRFEIVELEVFSHNLAAKRLYERFGFKHIGRIPRAVKRGDGYIDADLMQLEIL